MNILVVDDEMFICELLDEFLSRLGYEVTTATNGEEALAKFSEKRYSVVLLDIKMPGMNGRELLRRIKAIDSRTDVIVVSAFGDGVTVKDMLQMGADDFLIKPFELDNVEQLLSSRYKVFCEGNG
jgi:DNA-binding response OmpR family regulator